MPGDDAGGGRWADGPERLPITLVPAPGEALDGYLERLAGANGVPNPQLIRHLTRERVPTAFLTVAPDGRLIENLAAMSAVPAVRLERHTLRTLAGIHLDGLDPMRRATWRTVAARGWPPDRGSSLCPSCWREDGIWRLAWRHPWVTACTRHGEWLLENCPRCHRRFRTHRTPLQPLEAIGGTCGNPGGTRGRNCAQPLTELYSTAAPPAALQSQHRINAAISGETVSVLGRAIEPATYLGELKPLSVLLLHLAIQPGAQAIATWSDAARDDHQRSRGARGARWGLAPPAAMTLRGEALATADTILRQQTLEEAAEALRSWIDLTPPCNEGRLGWLADHTAMTPTLTRIVMAASATRRRLATRLDACRRIDLPGTAIPQALPKCLYRTQLAGLLDVGERSGRLFAALALARRSSHAQTWAHAARLLDLPADVGVDTAHACSGALLVNPDQFADAIDTVASLLDDVDYREREAAVHRLANTSGWYRNWAQIHHPGSRSSSRGYAITWLWTEYAEGHLASSPGWKRPPRAVDHAYYRRYVDRLSPTALTALLSTAVVGRARS